MSETKWTVEQQAAIDGRGQLLVAAAAGSGKTAVLVERLIQRITDLKERVDVDRFLVLTFTKAAANEMRERIGKALDDALFKETDSAEVEYLLHQRTLLHRSSINTLHSFCMELIRQNFYRIELDPAFRVADQAEADLLRQDVVEDLFEKYYGQENKSFHNLVEAFGSDRDDQALMENVLKLYEFSTSQVDPLAWLESLSNAYNWRTAEELANSEWGNSVRQAVKDKVEESINLIKRAYKLSIQPGGPIHYLQCLEDDLLRLQMLDKTLDNGSWSEVEEFFQEASKFPKLPAGPRKSKSCTETTNPESNAASIELKITEKNQKLILEEAKKARNEAKKKFDKLFKDLFQITLEEQLPRLKEMGDLAQTLADVVKEFSNDYAQAKRQRNIVDFSDLEHFALQILIDNQELTPVALALQERFAEVMVDEYQDINSVQEKILQSVSRQDGASPNLFMVGDVKQSIYRFRMADPRLFLAKYMNLPHWDASEKPVSEKLVIDLNRNFRSRREIIEGVNFLFRQIMTEGAGEIAYDDQAALCYGANFVSDHDQLKTAEGPIEVHLFDPQILKQTGQNQVSNDPEENGDWTPFKESREEDGANSETESLNSSSNEKTLEDEFSLEDLETVRIEARLVADRIQKIIMDKEFQIYDKNFQDFRPARYSDIVILTRSFSAIAPLYVEEFQAMGIPVYAETSSGYFGASEVETMLSLLKIIDNPRMDIPFASVLRSAFVGLNGTELGKLRSMLPQGDFYDAFIFAYWASQQLDKGICEAQEPEQTADEYDASGHLQEIQEILKPYSKILPELLDKAIKILKDAPTFKDKIGIFYTKLQDWRQFARQNSLADLLWYLYQETGYLAYVGTLPSGSQRQANLRALYDRACRFESTTYRGLFRFLRFLERFQGQGKDLGSARALGENEDVVRLITIHASKGLEFPIVFVVGLGKKFNTRSISGNLLLHSNLGVGIPLMDVDNRIRYPSFIQKAVKERLWQESLAEELRILYVALTRAKERLFLYGSLPKLQEEIQHWQSLASCTEQTFPNGQLRNAKHFLDWIGPALARHPDKLFGKNSFKAALSENDVDNNLGSINLRDDTSSWSVILNEALNSRDASLTKTKTENDGIEEAAKIISMESMKSVDRSPEEWYTEVDKRLSWLYPYPEAVHQVSKTNVSELKRRYTWNIGEYTADSIQTPQVKDYVRPKFVQTHQELTPAERGIAFHTLMEHLPLAKWAQSWDQFSEEEQKAQIEGLIQALVNHELLTGEQASVLSVDHVLGLMKSPVGKRLLLAQDVRREVPFSLMLPPQGVLIQGMIDALILSDDCKSAEILDYKTDHIRSVNFPEKALKDRYIVQLSLYALAVENLLKIKVTKATLYSVDLKREISISGDEIKRTQAKIIL
ncbi:UvrD-helicase domain-containing protein [Desulfitobacterium sp. Sab5]|uniref:UvrD-helicase domain-containing protein n=1 Tax=Desulfitobacterium nosdiversum TaxID=3375356 RepID=UPI003CE76A45